MSQLTEHFSEHELGVEGCDPRLLDNARYLCAEILEPLHAHYALPVRVHDGYRDPTHNDRAGGKPASFHLFIDGKAAVDVDVISVDCRTVFDWLRMESRLKFDKIILESKGGMPRCVHIQIDRGNPPRRQAFIGETGAATQYTQVECR